MVYLDTQSWNGSTYSDTIGWGDADVPKTATDTLLVSVADTRTVSLSIAASDTLVAIGADTAQPPVSLTIVPKTASDTLVGIIGDTSRTPVILTGSTFSYVDPQTWNGLTYSDPIAWDQPLTFKTAQDALVPIIVEAPTGAYIWSATDDLVPAAGEVSTPLVPSIIAASDTLVPTFAETASVGGQVIAVSASDTLTAAIADTTRTLVQALSIVSSDILILSIVDRSVQILPIDAPVVGVLPPGWTEVEVEEMTGIERPNRYEPSNVTPLRGWFKRKSWYVYDEHGALRATDRWQSAARAQAWTQYHSGKQSIAA